MPFNLIHEEESVMEENKVGRKQKGATRGSKAQFVYTVDSMAGGIVFGRTRVKDPVHWRDELALALTDEEDLVKFRQRFNLDERMALPQLEAELQALAEKGILRQTHIVLGSTTDPFYPFDSKFDGTMKFLSLFKKYTPGLLTIQTRSPLIVLAMPILTQLGRRAAVTMGIETMDEEVVRRYTPGLPRAEERLKAARALRSFGIEVTLQVAPVLPYADWRRDAAAFAEALAGAADKIYLRNMLDISETTQTRAKYRMLTKALAQDRKFHWLRRDSTEPLMKALQVMAPEKLTLAAPVHLEEKQLSMFAA